MSDNDSEPVTGTDKPGKDVPGGRKSSSAHDHASGSCWLSHAEHDCLTREHDPDEWCPDCFFPEARR